MTRDAGVPVLCAIFVDYDNIYLSLKRKNEDAAKRFSKNAGLWLKALESGRLLTSSGGPIAAQRRVVMTRCYGNPVPRRNQTDNSTDMNSFPFVRHHYLRSGFEVVDCPPLTAQMKNSADIRMVMDLRDLLTHPTHFDEFIILSGDADFTPVLHRLRQHARRTFVYANDFTAAPYSAIADGEVREADLIALLLGEAGAGDVDVAPRIAAPTAMQAPPAHVQAAAPQPAPVVLTAQPVQATAQLAPLRMEDLRAMIIAEVVAQVKASPAPVPLEALADRAQRSLGHERTVGTNWAGAGSFSQLLRHALPGDVRLSENPPFFAYDPSRHLIQAPQVYEPPRQIPAQVQQPLTMQGYASQPPMHAPAAPADHAGYAETQTRFGSYGVPDPRQQQTALRSGMATPAPQQPQPQPHAYHAMPEAAAPQPVAPHHHAEHGGQMTRQAPAALQSRAQPMQPAYAPPSAPIPTPQRTDAPSPVQRSIARIHEASQVPPMAPQDYRALFEVMSAEIAENGLAGTQTLQAITERAEARGLGVSRDDVRFILEVISEADPWFEQGASANLFAGRFRNHVVARCRDQGLDLSADELDLIDAWFAGAQLSTSAAAARASLPPVAPAPREQATPQAPSTGSSRGGRWWSNEPAASQSDETDAMPRIVRARRG